MNGEAKVYIVVLLGVLLIASAFSPIDSGLAAFLEWGGAFLVFAGLSYTFKTRSMLCLNMVAFTAGSLGDSWLLGVNPLGWPLTNYMLFVHSSLGALTGLLLKK